MADKKATTKSVAKKKAPVKKKATAAVAKKPTAAAPAAKKPAPKPAPKKKAAAPASRSATQRSTTSTNLRALSSADTAYTNFTPYKEKKGEEYMNEAQSDHFRDILNGWKIQLMGKVDETVHHMQDDAANFPDPNDRASQESDFAMELRTRDRERKLIKKIEESLDAIDEHEYGFCSQCGVEIGIRRLEARPTATECIDCKTLNEIREKQYGK